MSLNKDVEVLRKIPLFAKLEPAKLKLLAFTSERLEYQAGDELFAEGDIGDAAYIVLKGHADIVVRTPNGPVTVAKVGPGEIVGEIAILCDVPRTASVVAHDDLAVLRIAKENFFKMLTQFPQMSIEIMNELAMRLYHTTQNLTSVKNELADLQRLHGGEGGRA
ncbi:MAG: cyclic nucleotide-binding domain-containing protein [Geminicoccaceae bacterium]